MRREQDVSKSNVNWNRRAAEFSLCCNSTDDSYMFFLENHVQIRNKRVLDIGSGAGRYLEKLLDKGARAEGLEPAAQMREQAKLYLKRKGYGDEQIVLHSEDFQSFKPKVEYDYLFISNNPMIGFIENYEKVKSMGTKGIFVGSWLAVEESLLQRLAGDLRKPIQPRIRENLYVWLHLFIHDGYNVDFKVIQKDMDEYTLPEEVQHRYTSWIYGEDYSEECVRKVREVLDSYERQSKGIYQTVSRVNGMLYAYKKK